ncbi:MAG TPA: hypothetical protein VF898_11165 [Chloroflexota bacterium]
MKNTAEKERAMENVLTAAEAQSFAEKLEEFGNKLNPKEQLLLSEILWRASALEDDVSGHAMVLPALPRPWTELRTHLGEIVMKIMEEYGRYADISGMTTGYPFKDS